MTFHVQCQVVGPRKTAVTVTTLERLGARVFPVVPGQLVTPREPPLAAVPGTLVGLLTFGGERKEGDESQYLRMTFTFYRDLLPVCVLWCAFRWELFV